MSKSAAVFIAIGTELSSGQVVNTNSAWLAQHFADFGFEPLLHVTVPDQRDLILDALHQARHQSDLILVMGGLGPTSDDFTREIIAEWSHAPLVFNPASWQRLETRAQKMGFVLGVSQKQQCWFPEGAEVIVNPARTADAFKMQVQETHVFVLPGPPSEIKALWDSQLQTELVPFFPEQPKQHLYTWQCLGMGEGTLGEHLEKILEGSGLKTGYRAHSPYIEVKVWIPESISAEEWVPKIETAMVGAVFVKGNSTDVVRHFFDCLPTGQEIQILDYATCGALAHRLQAGYAEAQTLPQITLQSVFSEQGFMTEADMRQHIQGLSTHHLLMMIGGINEAGEWSLGLHWREQFMSRRFKLPFKRKAALNQRFVTELALIYWQEWLNALD